MMRCFIVLLAAGCITMPVAAQKIKSIQFNPSADFSSYKTYTWLPVKTLESSGVVENNPTFTPVVKGAIGQHLKSKGMQEVPGGGDLQIVTFGFRYSSPQMEALAAIEAPINGTWELGGPIGRMSRYNEEGTLAINLIDTKTKTSSWLAIATASLEKREHQDKNAERVRKAVAKMFEHYPPKAKK